MPWHIARLEMPVAVAVALVQPWVSPGWQEQLQAPPKKPELQPQLQVLKSCDEQLTTGPTAGCEIPVQPLAPSQPLCAPPPDVKQLARTITPCLAVPWGQVVPIAAVMQVLLEHEA